MAARDTEALFVSAFGPQNLAFVEELHEAFHRDPGSVDPAWRAYFGSLEPPLLPAAAEPTAAPPLPGGNGVQAGSALVQERVQRLVEGYRELGHLCANLDPLGLVRRRLEELRLESFGLSTADLERSFSTEGVAGPDRTTLRELVLRLSETYCRTIGVELAHLHDVELRDWLQNRMESTRNRIDLRPEEQRRLLEKLTEAEALEQFLQKKFLGTKRFSLEGAESLIPLLDRLLERAGHDGVREVVIGMAHRGRLNVLANVLAKPAAEIFAEFLDRETSLAGEGGGDVKYHLGYSNDRVTAGGKLHLSLSFNPSHLEWITNVVQGRVRAKQDRYGDRARERCLPLLLHGDAAFAGQGIVAETLNLSALAGYAVGGTVHIVINNQVGFTTPPAQAYSTTYATDVARMLQIPIFHVNGEDPEAVAQVVELAVDFRQRFHRDALIELWCYRKYGHNEGDEPSFTQPVMYRAIARHPSIRESYIETLSRGSAGLTRADADAIAHKAWERLERALEEAHELQSPPRPSTLAGAWSRYRGGTSIDVPDAETAVPADRLARVAQALVTLPEGFHPHPKIVRLLEQRAAMGRGERLLDWGMGEALAFGTLLDQGVRVRLTGQDSERGTFSHRHAVLFDYETGTPYAPLAHIQDQQGVFEIHNSPLSEAAVLAFEYGYSLDMPEGLVLWEAQFGDFVNAAQVVVDQFLCSSEAKWNRVSGLCLLLPHGMEGQGPEHSSARLERFLNLCVNDNMQVCNVTTPANFFHLLRRQVLRPYRKPLVVMTPKSLLRHPQATSPLEELVSGRFRHIIPDPEAPDPANVRRVLLCTGKVYYDLAAARVEQKIGDVAIIRIEKLYPFRVDELLGLLSVYREGTPVVWVQEEPRNMGAWNTMNAQLPGVLRGFFPLEVVSRPLSASPATGSASRHKLEQARLVEDAFAVEARTRASRRKRSGV